MPEYDSIDLRGAYRRSVAQFERPALVHSLIGAGLGGGGAGVSYFVGKTNKQYANAHLKPAVYFGRRALVYA